MSRFMNILTKIITVLCAFCFVGTALVSLFLVNVDQHAFDPDIYKQALINGNFYQDLPSLLGSALAKGSSTNNTPFVKNLTGENWAAIIQTLLPQEQLQALTEDAITQFFAYLNGETGSPHLSLEPLKQKLSGPAGMEAAISLIHAQPDCSAEQLTQMIVSFGQVLCNPPQTILNLARPAIQTQLSLIAASIPDQISFTDAGIPKSRAGNLRDIRLAMQFSPFLPLIFLFLITLLAIRTFKDWMAWWGWPILLTGITGALAGFRGAPLFRMALENYISTRTQLNIPPELSPAMHVVADEVFQEILRPAGWQAVALAAIGLIMLLIAWTLSQLEKNQRIQRSEAKTQARY
jgi:hypothetical protein